MFKCSSMRAKFVRGESCGMWRVLCRTQVTDVLLRSSDDDFTWQTKKVRLSSKGRNFPRGTSHLSHEPRRSSQFLIGTRDHFLPVSDTTGNKRISNKANRSSNLNK